MSARRVDVAPRPPMPNSILHQIPCCVELCQLLSQVSDTEIYDLVTIASDQGPTIIWTDNSADECAFVGMADPSISPTDEPFSIALKHIHQNKLAGQYAEAQNKLKEKNHNIYLDWDRTNKYNNDYLNLAIQMDESIKTWQVKQEQLAQHIQQAVDGLLAGDICNIIAGFCNEDRLDQYDCRKVFDDYDSEQFNPIGRLEKTGLYFGQRKCMAKGKILALMQVIRSGMTSVSECLAQKK
eukprot:916401_1